MALMDWLLLLVLITMIVGLAASHWETVQLREKIFQLRKQKEIDRGLIARYEIAIQSLPPEYRQRMLTKISEVK